MLAPSWKQTMNYESVYMDATEMVDATYEAGADIARIKGEFGITSQRGGRGYRAAHRRRAPPRCTGSTT